MAQNDDQIDLVILTFVSQRVPNYQSKTIGTWKSPTVDTSRIMLSARRLLNEDRAFLRRTTTFVDNDSNIITRTGTDGRTGKDGIYGRFPLDSSEFYRDSMNTLELHASLNRMIAMLDSLGRKDEADKLRHVKPQGTGEFLEIDLSRDGKGNSQDSADSKDNSFFSGQDMRKQNAKTVSVTGGSLTTTHEPKTPKRKVGSRGHILPDDIFYGAIGDGGTFATGLPLTRIELQSLRIDSSSKVTSIEGLISREYKWQAKTSCYSISGSIWIAPVTGTANEDLAPYIRLDSLMDLFHQTDRIDRIPILLPMGRKFLRQRGMPVMHDITISIPGGSVQFVRRLVRIDRARVPLDFFAPPPGFVYKSLLEP